MVQPKRCLALLDDDPLVHATWQMVSKHLGEILFASFTLEDFLAKNISNNIPVYVDHHLGIENGTLIAKQLLDLGYESVFLCTGLNPEHLQALKGLSGIVGKDYPLSPTKRAPCPT